MMEKEILKALEGALKKEGEVIKKRLVEEFDRELSHAIAGLSLTLLKTIDIQSSNERIIITIKND